MEWIKKLLADSNGDPSTKRILYVIVVLASIVWLSIGLHKEGLSSGFIQVFTILVGAVTSGYLGGVIFAEKKPDSTEENK